MQQEYEKLSWNTLSSTEEISPYQNECLPVSALPKNFIHVPFCRQGSNWACGVSCLQSLFHYYGYEIREDNLAKLLKSGEEHGTNMSEIIGLAKRVGLETQIIKSMPPEKLKEYIDSGIPVMVCMQAWSDDEDGLKWSTRWEDGHYVLVVGYDMNHFFFMDPSTLSTYAFIPQTEFLERWHDYDINPETNEKNLYVQTALIIKKDDVNCRKWSNSYIFRMY